MPYTLTWEPQGVCRRYHGDMSIAERRRSFDEIAADERFDGLRFAITDYLDVAHYEITPMATMEIAAMHIGPLITNPRMVMAAVVTRPDIVAAIEDFRSQGFTHAAYRIFATQAEARDWIEGLDG
ncbi:MAG: hypothetical protein KBC73_03570 [Burkholderiaceae bacterium]|nr:hypothetical protein [Burkholderiaceae bacterium]